VVKQKMPTHRQERDVETAENEDEDSGGDEHPAVRNLDDNQHLCQLFPPFNYCCSLLQRNVNAALAPIEFCVQI
jgi:hypothetical protein